MLAVTTSGHYSVDAHQRMLSAYISPYRRGAGSQGPLSQGVMLQASMNSVNPSEAQSGSGEFEHSFRSRGTPR